MDDLTVINTYLKYQAGTCFRILYDRYAAKIFSKAYTMLGDEKRAEDATQEIFTKIFLNLRKFNGKSKFSTWVYSVTYNFCIDLIRKNKKKKNLFADELENPPDLKNEEVPDEDLLRMEVRKLKEVLRRLNDRDRSILLMKYQDEMSIRDIAGIIGKKESAVKMQLKRAKEKAKRIHDELPNVD
ncbi:RNA polymerase subunit sigma-24 [Lewinellaceae bacterium SD302]|nr:RNA polymerase subunit sigma-24 [Lewinellaceae bacterium SD302]